ncbi:MAG: hypothetical protein INR72_20675, partial [Williamsia herbipolensis]|nr:hypothetical protein [Williamsia herbipolensis]
SGSSSDAMLPRAGTTFAPSTGPASGFGSIALDGTSGYASSVTASTAASGPALLGTANYGLGIWFKTTSTTPGALFGLGTDPLDQVGLNNDRILYLDGSGRIGFVAATGLGNILSLGTAAGVSGYNDGNWHYAYVAMTVLKIVAGLTSTVTLLVDGKQVSQKLIVGLVSYAGYWHVGWSPVSGVGRYFNGSLSGFTVDESGTAPTAASATSNPTSYTSFDPTRTAQWRFDDSGGSFDGTTALGVLPSGTALPGNATAPCSSIDLAWDLAAPAATVTASTPMSTLVSAGWKPVSANPDPGATQTSTITLKRDATFSAYSVGLILYAPLQMEYSVNSTWTTLFTWDAPAPNTAVGSTFVVGAS